MVNIANGSGAWNMEVCFACGKGPIIRYEHNYTFTCRYCNLSWSQELLAMGNPQDIIVSSRGMWEHRLKIAKSLSDQALMDIAAARGLVPKIEVTKMQGQAVVSPEQLSVSQMMMMKQVYENKIMQHLNGADIIHHESHKAKPVWSYEEAAASEFNVMDGEGGLS